VKKERYRSHWGGKCGGKTALYLGERGIRGTEREENHTAKGVKCLKIMIIFKMAPILGKDRGQNLKPAREQEKYAGGEENYGLEPGHE